MRFLCEISISSHMSFFTRSSNRMIWKVWRGYTILYNFSKYCWILFIIFIYKIVSVLKLNNWWFSGAFRGVSYVYASYLRRFNNNSLRTHLSGWGKPLAGEFGRRQQKRGNYTNVSVSGNARIQSVLNKRYGALWSPSPQWRLRVVFVNEPDGNDTRIPLVAAEK